MSKLDLLEPSSPALPRTLIDDLLAEQQRLTAVMKFSQKHERGKLGGLPAQAKYYRDLIPLSKPNEGEQYAFAVDLDACTGCKACVTACHNLNGLDEDEIWRTVGLLHGGTVEKPVQQTVTSACHHCVDPACLNGCPVNAYDKDEVTGIVGHLDDQCIGCQYCILKCPYDVPKYSKKRGIVRKCDMCSSRLAVGEAPACVQACPNQAIRITTVNKAEIAARSKMAGSFLPGAPDPAYTQPTTRYTRRNPLPENSAPADFHRVEPEHSHPPLVIMLTLTQLSVGAFCVTMLLRLLFPANLMTHLSPFHSVVALVLGLLAIGASTLHLGRPFYAWRAVVGLKKSWLSREIVVFGLFAGLAMLNAAVFSLPAILGMARGVIPLPAWIGNPALAHLLNAGTSLSGLLGVFCSLMIYSDTRRKFWSGNLTSLRFFGTMALLGTATILFVTTLQALISPGIATLATYHQLTDLLSVALAAISAAKLALELTVFKHLRNREFSLMKRTAMLMTDELAEITTIRFIAGIAGGIALPLAFLIEKPAPGFTTLGVTVWLLTFALLGELLERYLFFTAVIPPKMPGGLAS